MCVYLPMMIILYQPSLLKVSSPSLSFLHFLFLYFFFLYRILCTITWPGTYYIAKGDHEFLILLILHLSRARIIPHCSPLPRYFY